MSIGSIYMITNRVNLKRYVGLTRKTVGQRFKDHLTTARAGRGWALHRAIRKHGEENFSIEEIVRAEKHLLPDLEKHYIKLFGTGTEEGHGYNVADGGTVGGVPYTEARRQKLSASLRAAYVKKPLTPEYSELMAAKRRGKPAHNKGVRGVIKASAETRAKLVAVRTGRVCPESTREKIRASLMGHPVSEETRSKLWANRRRKSQ